MLNTIQRPMPLPDLQPSTLTRRLSEQIADRWTTGTFGDLADAMIDTICNDLEHRQAGKLDPRLARALLNRLANEIGGAA